MESSISQVISQPAGQGSHAQTIQRTQPSLPSDSASTSKKNLVFKPVPILAVEPEQRAKQIQEAVEKLNEQMKSLRRDLGFSYDDRLNREIVTVRKEGSGEVVRQLPPEVVLRVAHSIEDLKGLLYDDIF
jgi:flagellar protein FlaG